MSLDPLLLSELERREAEISKRRVARAAEMGKDTWTLSTPDYQEDWLFLRAERLKAEKGKDDSAESLKK